MFLQYRLPCLAGQPAGGLHNPVFPSGCCDPHMTGAFLLLHRYKQKVPSADNVPWGEYPNNWWLQFPAPQDMKKTFLHNIF